MNERVNYCLFGVCRINRARIVTEAARQLNVLITKTLRKYQRHRPSIPPRFPETVEQTIGNSGYEHGKPE